MKVIARRMVLLALPLALAACGLGGLGAPSFSLDSITVVAEPNANRNRPVAVDLVLIKDSGALDQIATLSAGDWFQRKQQFLRDFPKGLAIVSWEPVPALSLPERVLTDPETDGAMAGIVFADYGTPGDHRARLESAGSLRLRLMTDDFAVETIRP